MFVKKLFTAMILHEKKFKIDSVAVSIFIRYPGTEFYRKFEKEGRIICTDYTNYNGTRSS